MAPNKTISYIDNSTLLKIRIAMYVIVFVFLIVNALLLLNLDFESHTSPNVRKYAGNKWKLITTWFNLITIAYLPICVYCDYRETMDDTSSRVKTLKEIKTFLFTNIIFPVTMFSDVLFWRLWNFNKELVMPKELESLVTVNSQHAMHTFSLVFVILDLLLVPRQRPKSMTKGISTLFGFVSLYIAVCVHGIINGDYIYPCFQNLSGLKVWMLGVYVYTGHLFYYLGQWLLVDIIWRTRQTFL